MVDIVVGSIPPVYNNQNSGNNQSQPRQKKRKRIDRRKNKTDRRQCVRAGVVVTLSHQVDRRNGTDRRKP
jgi:hypothetical protein